MIFERVGDHVDIDLETAFRRNHMCSLLNDRALGLVPPLEFRMTMEKALHEASAKESGLKAGDDEGARQTSLVVTNVRLFAGGRRCSTAREGLGLVLDPARAVALGGRLPGCRCRHVGDGVHHSSRGSARGAGLSIIGWVSELYTRMFYSGTTTLAAGTPRSSGSTSNQAPSHG